MTSLHVAAHSQTCRSDMSVRHTDSAADPAELKSLEVAIRGATLELSIERSQQLARAAEARLLRTQRRAAAGIKGKVSPRLCPLFFTLRYSQRERAPVLQTGHASLLPTNCCTGCLLNHSSPYDVA